MSPQDRCNPLRFLQGPAQDRPPLTAALLHILEGTGYFLDKGLLTGDLPEIHRLSAPIDGLNLILPLDAQNPPGIVHDLLRAPIASMQFIIPHLLLLGAGENLPPHIHHAVMGGAFDLLPHISHHCEGIHGSKLLDRQKT